MSIPPSVERALTDAMTHRSLAEGLRRRITAAQAQLEASTERAETARERTATERTDVDRLEDLTWSWIVAKLSGHFDDRLEREKTELQAAEYAYRTERETTWLVARPAVILATSASPTWNDCLRRNGRHLSSSGRIPAG